MSKTICLDISVLNEREKTGVGVYTYQLIKALLKINRSDKFILFGFATYFTFDYLKNLEFKNYSNVEMKIYKIPAKFFRRTFLLWQKLNWPKIEKLVGEFDFFHSFNWNLPPINNGKMIATVFDMTSLLFPNLHQKKTIQLDKVRLQRIKKYADLVITISQNSKKDFLKFSPKSHVDVIYPGVGENFLSKNNKSEVLRKYNLEPNFILSVGTLEPRKNITGLIKAYLKSGIKQKLVLVGNWGWENNELAKLIQENLNKITALGFIPDEDLPHIYRNALAFVYPSFYEGFGIPVLEALFLGVPVIVSKNSSLTEVGGDAVIYINPHNTQSIVSALSKIQDERIREGLIKKGHIQAKMFSWETSAKKLNYLYQLL